MRTKRSVTGLIVKTIATGAVLTALTVTAPDVYHDMGNGADARPIAADSETTSATPDVYHDM
jgi:hypothetical protein